MKKTLIIAVVVVALVLGVVAYAIAADPPVTVTAKVNPKFELTLDDNVFTYADDYPLGLDPGASYTIAGPEVTVKSNKTWSWTEGVVTVAPDDALVLGKQSQYKIDSQGAEGAKGVVVMDYTYGLDLTADDSWEIDPNDYVFTYPYTALQD